MAAETVVARPGWLAGWLENARRTAMWPSSRSLSSISCARARLCVASLAIDRCWLEEVGAVSGLFGPNVLNVQQKAWPADASLLPHDPHPRLPPPPHLGGKVGHGEGCERAAAGAADSRGQHCLSR